MKIIAQILARTKNAPHICGMNDANKTKSSAETPKWFKVSKEFANSLVYANNVDVFEGIVFHDKSISELDLDANVHSVSGIYCILNVKNNNLYIGVSNDIKSRICAHKRDLAKSRHSCKKMNVDFNLDPESFIFFSIECASSNEYRDYDKMRDTLLAKEASYINSVSKDRLYNNFLPAKDRMEDPFLSINDSYSTEKGVDLRTRLGVSERAFQTMWKRKLEYPFSAKKVCTKMEVEVMELAYSRPELSKKKMKRVGRKAASNVVPPTAVVLDKIEVVEASVVFNRFRTPALFVAFIIPTIASVSNTFLVSHALSGNAYTSAALTGVASATSILFLWAGVKGATSWGVVLLTLGFEAFCNAASVFKSLMASLAYSITTVSGKPSDFLDMVSNFTGLDHQDVAKGIAYLVAVMIASAQVSSLYELKK